MPLALKNFNPSLVQGTYIKVLSIKQQGTQMLLPGTQLETLAWVTNCIYNLLLDFECGLNLI